MDFVLLAVSRGGRLPSMEDWARYGSPSSRTTLRIVFKMRSGRYCWTRPYCRCSRLLGVTRRSRDQRISMPYHLKMIYPVAVLLPMPFMAVRSGMLHPARLSIVVRQRLSRAFLLSGPMPLTSEMSRDSIAFLSQYVLHGYGHEPYTGLGTFRSVQSICRFHVQRGATTCRDKREQKVNRMKKKRAYAVLRL